MSNTKNALKLSDKCRVDTHANDGMDDGGDVITCNPTESCTYSVTVSKKTSPTGEDGLFSGQKSFISIHSTDHPCQVANADNLLNIDDCNLEVLSLNDVFPSTSDESVSNGDESPVRRKQKKNNKNKGQKVKVDGLKKTANIPSDNKASSPTGEQREPSEGQPSGFPEFDIPKSTMYVVGSNPGEPKMSYPDSPKKMSKTMKKFLRNIDKQKGEQHSKSSEKAISKLTTVRGILKDGRCGPECTGDSSVQDSDDFNPPEDYSLPYTMDFGSQNYAKQIPDKNVSFNTQVVIIHFTGDLCVGQSIETLSKEKDQQARNSELRKTFLTKYNEFWPTQK